MVRNMPARTPIARLIAGFKGFRAYYVEQRGELLESLVKDGQRPPVMLIGCSDSRVDPAIMLHSEPGEVFVVRNVANLVPPYDPASPHAGICAALEFGVRDLGVAHIVVLGHSRCGGIRALVEQTRAPTCDREFIGAWVSIARKACEQYDGALGEDGSHSDAARAVEQAAVGLSLANLMTFPWVRERVGAGTLHLHGWWVDLAAGELWGRDPVTGRFDVLA